MTRIGIWLATTVTVVVLLFGYHTSTNSSSTAGVGAVASAPLTTPTPAPTAPARPAPTITAPPPAKATAPAASSAAPTPTPTSATGTYTGEVAQTEWGPVQVQLTVAAGRITAVQVPQYPNGNPRDAEINSYALPTLIQETEQQQSAQIDMVSGATVTSTGYLQSLQSALDKAGL